MLASFPLLLSLPALTCATGIHRLPLTKLKRETVNHDYEIQALSQKYGGQQSPITPDAGHNLPLESMFTRPPMKHPQLTIHSSDFMNAQYISEISIGTPPQSVSI